MTRAAKLAAVAREILPFEKDGLFNPTYSRSITRLALADHAEEMGFAPKEISAAVDAALAAAGTTP